MELSYLKLTFIFHLVLYFLFASAGEDSTNDSVCSMVKCYNDGKAVYRDSICVCMCQPNYSGLLCEYDLQPSVWPSGPYALLMPTSGCPESEDRGWSHGVFNFTAVDKVWLYKQDNGSNRTLGYSAVSGHEPNHAITVNNFSQQINFCFKHNTSLSPSSWPNVLASVFGTDDGCPIEFEETTFTIPLPRLRSWFTDGYLPGVFVEESVTGSKLNIKLCILNERSGSIDVTDGNSFIQVKALDENCSDSFLNFKVGEQVMALATIPPDITNWQQMAFSVCHFSIDAKSVNTKSKWPNGPYALLMDIEGCPKPTSNGWGTGYINFITSKPIRYRYFETDSIPINNGTGNDTRNLFRIGFCTRNDEGAPETPGLWPYGSYGIFGTKEGCPVDFMVENYTIALPTELEWSSSGQLPHFVIDSKLNELTLRYCQRKPVFTANRKVAWENKFTLIKKDSTTCKTSIYKFNIRLENRSIIALENDNGNNETIDIQLCSFTPTKESGCQADNYACGEACILRSMMCQGEYTREDCQDGSDEDSQVCLAFKCKENELFCDDWICVPRLFLCDGFQNCEDGTDELEENCYLRNITHEECFDAEYRCYDGKCIPKTWLCDSVNDCDGGEDEGGSICIEKCPESDFRCSDGNCISDYLVCDYNNDCNDGSDENDDICRASCSGDAFQCDDFQCIVREMVCNGVVNCKNGIDENELICNQTYDSASTCQQDLGLSDGSIADQNIYASSWEDDHTPEMVRPSHNSWCPLPNDKQPFIQIDLLMANVVGGLVLLNRVERTSKLEDVFVIPYFVVIGCKSFSLYYGMLSEKLMPYRAKPFEIMPSDSIEQAQTFIFNKPFIARYLRIYLLQRLLSGKFCLQIELLGCPRADTGDSQVVLSKRRIHNFDTVVSNFTLISSPGFPMYYQSDMVYKWHIHTTSGGYLRLTFTVISLHNSLTIPSSVCQEDRILFENYFDPVTSSHNGQILTFPTDQSQFMIAFHTCKRYYMANTTKEGFRVVVKREDYPTVWGRDIKCYNYLNVISPSLLGFHSSAPEYMWEIYSAECGGPIFLEFEYINIPCDLGVTMSVTTNRDSTYKFCNDQKYPSKFKSWVLEIWIGHIDHITMYNPRGFRATMKIEKISRSYESKIDTSYVKLADSIEAEDNFEVCSKRFSKCYRYERSFLYVDWHTQRQRCEAEGYTMLFPKTRDEMNFVKSWIYHRVFEFYTSGRVRPYEIKRKISYYGQDYSYILGIQTLYTHIGLVHRKGRDRSRFVWMDGTTLSFTAWDDDQPNKLELNECVGLWINLTTSETTWRTTTCQSPPEKFVEFQYAIVCEKVFNFSISSDEKIIGNQEMHITQNRSKVLPNVRNCTNGEWIHRFSVCDGINDCSDNSDEEECVINKSKCVSTDFRCRNGECLHIGRVCDFVSDCLDGSDELSCRYPDCQESMFRCLNHQCIPDSARCDAVTDCRDGSDEDICVTCQPSSAFLCGDQTCIPKRLVCDNFADCVDGKDESNCTHSFDSCEEYWNNGYFEDVSFISGWYPYYWVRCVYSRSDNNSIRIVSELKDFGVLSRNNDFLGKGFLITEVPPTMNSCTQKVWEACVPSISATAEYEDPLFTTTFSHCRPRTIDIFMNHNCKNCSWTESSNNRVGIHVNRMAANANLWKPNLGLFVHAIRRKVSQDIELQFETSFSAISCTQDFPFGNNYMCGDGELVSNRSLCIYDFNKAGFIDGCGNLRHLEDCEHFLCPPDFFKCPKSFCLSLRFVCDGIIQCADGADEIDCKCDRNTGSIRIIVQDEINTREDNIHIYNFARQFYNNYNKVFVYTLNITRNLTLSYKGRQVHHYDENLNHHNVEERTESFLNIDTELFEIDDDSDNTTIMYIIKNEASRHKSFEKYLKNSTLAKRIYTVRIGTHSDKRYTMIETKGKDDLLLESIKRLDEYGTRAFPGICKEQHDSRCIGMYRCSSSRICLSMEQVCDGKRQCEYGDDETSCDFTCPSKCVCDTYIANCQLSNFTINDLKDVNTTTRMLNISLNVLSTQGEFVFDNSFPLLIRLAASNCKIREIRRTFIKTPNLRYLDLSKNEINSIHREMFIGLENLEQINLDDNYFLSHIEALSFSMLSRIKVLRITKTRIREMLPETFSGLDLTTLDISYNQITKINDFAFKNLSVEELVFTGNDVQDFNSHIFTGVHNMKNIQAPEFKFCCFKPTSISEDDCYPYKDAFSSCEDLMRNPILQTMLWVIGAAALLGNTCTIGYRLCHDREKIKKGYGMFVTSLAVSDFFMGVYLVIIAAADLSFRNEYILVENYWRNSVWCTIAGVLATFSSEASVLFMSLITIDRILVIKYPFGQWKFDAKSSRVAVTISWLIAFSIAMVPIVVVPYFEGRFYSGSGVCLALPLTQRGQSGWLYNFLVYTAFNFVAFIFIAIGQLVIYVEIKRSVNKMRKFSTQRRNDVRVAQNLLLVLLTDFFCWFPIGVMSIMTASGYEIQGDVYAWSAVLIVPVNSALNPFLYTLSAILRQKEASSQKTQTNTYEGSITYTKDRETHQIVKTMREVMSQNTELKPKETLIISLSMFKSLRNSHAQDLIYGGVSIDDIVLNCANKHLVYLPVPTRDATMADDKSRDVFEFGKIIEILLNKTGRKQIKV